MVRTSPSSRTFACATATFAFACNRASRGFSAISSTHATMTTFAQARKKRPTQNSLHGRAADDQGAAPEPHESGATVVDSAGIGSSCCCQYGAWFVILRLYLHYAMTNMKQFSLLCDRLLGLRVFDARINWQSRRAMMTRKPTP